METSEKFLLGMVVLLVVLFVVGIEMQQKEDFKKLDYCTTLANKIGLDPNDEKINFIKNCYETE